MNKIYRLKFSQEQKQVVVVSEIAKGQDRKSGSNLITLATLTLSLLSFLTTTAHAAPTEANIVNGQVQIQSQGNVTTITNTDNAIINWNDFSIQTNEIVNFIQEHANSSVLNRVTGGSISEINGIINSNGNVFVINPNGIIFGKDATVNANSFIASTLDITNENFKDTNYIFNAKDNAITNVINNGVITVNQQGKVALIGGAVENSGVINTDNGDVLLLAGNSITVFNLTNPRISYIISADSKAVNLGKIFTQGGNIHITGQNVEERGIIKTSGGKIFLTANADTTISGVVDASSHTGQAGEIRALGSKVKLTSTAKVLATGKQGGEVYLGGDDKGAGKAGFILAQETFIADNATINVSANSETGDAGRIIVWGNQAVISGNYFAQGGNTSGKGGFIETSGKQIQIEKAININTKSRAGTSGTWLIDPHNIKIVASRLNVGSALTIPFLARENNSYILNSTIVSALVNGNVTIDTGVSGDQEGNIEVLADIVHEGVNKHRLTFNSTGNYTQNNSEINGGSAGLDVFINTSNFKRANFINGAKVILGHGRLESYNATLFIDNAKIESQFHFRNTIKAYLPVLINNAVLGLVGRDSFIDQKLADFGNGVDSLTSHAEPSHNISGTLHTYGNVSFSFASAENSWDSKWRIKWNVSMHSHEGGKFDITGYWGRTKQNNGADKYSGIGGIVDIYQANFTAVGLTDKISINQRPHTFIGHPDNFPILATPIWVASEINTYGNGSINFNNTPGSGQQSNTFVTEIPYLNITTHDESKLEIYNNHELHPNRNGVLSHLDYIHLTTKTPANILRLHLNRGYGKEFTVDNINLTGPGNIDLVSERISGRKITATNFNIKNANQVTLEEYLDITNFNVENTTLVNITKHDLAIKQNLTIQNSTYIANLPTLIQGNLVVNGTYGETVVNLANTLTVNNNITVTNGATLNLNSNNAIAANVNLNNANLLQGYNLIVSNGINLENNANYVLVQDANLTANNISLLQSNFSAGLYTANSLNISNNLVLNNSNFSTHLRDIYLANETTPFLATGNGNSNITLKVYNLTANHNKVSFDNLTNLKIDRSFEININTPLNISSLGALGEFSFGSGITNNVTFGSLSTDSPFRLYLFNANISSEQNIDILHRRNDANFEYTKYADSIIAGNIQVTGADKNLNLDFDGESSSLYFTGNICVSEGNITASVNKINLGILPSNASQKFTLNVTGLDKGYINFKANDINLSNSSIFAQGKAHFNAKNSTFIKYNQTLALTAESVSLQSSGLFIEENATLQTTIIGDHNAINPSIQPGTKAGESFLGETSILSNSAWISGKIITNAPLNLQQQKATNDALDLTTDSMITAPKIIIGDYNVNGGAKIAGKILIPESNNNELSYIKFRKNLNLTETGCLTGGNIIALANVESAGNMKGIQISLGNDTSTVNLTGGNIVTSENLLFNVENISTKANLTTSKDNGTIVFAANNINLTGGRLMSASKVQIGKLDNTSNIAFTGAVQLQTPLTQINAQDFIATSASELQGVDLEINANNNATLNGLIQTGKDILVRANNTSVNNELIAANDIKLQANNVLVNTTAIINAGNLSSLGLVNSNTTINGDVLGTEGIILAGKEITTSNSAKLSSINKTITLGLPETSNISLNGSLNSFVDINVQANNISTSGSLTAKNNINLHANNTLINAGEKISAGNFVDIGLVTGNSTVDGSVTGTKGVALHGREINTGVDSLITATNTTVALGSLDTVNLTINGSVVSNGSLTAYAEDIVTGINSSIKSLTGNITIGAVSKTVNATIAGELTAATNISLHNSHMNINAIVTAANNVTYDSVVKVDLQHSNTTADTIIFGHDENTQVICNMSTNNARVKINDPCYVAVVSSNGNSDSNPDNPIKDINNSISVDFTGLTHLLGNTTNLSTFLKNFNTNSLQESEDIKAICFNDVNIKSDRLHKSCVVFPTKDKSIQDLDPELSLPEHQSYFTALNTALKGFD